MRATLLAGLLVAVVTAGCGGASHPVLRLQVTPAVSVEDQPVSIRFEGLRRLQGVWLELRSTDAKGRVFLSRAAFGADKSGVLDLARARTALAGSAYSGTWPMGLVTSMTAPYAPPLTDYAWGSAPRRFVLTAISASRAIASTTFVRRWRQGTYTTVRATVDRGGFVGTFYAPTGVRNQEAVLAIGGEEGGIGSSWLGERLAAHGIPTLVVGYFHAPGLPDRLKDIPLEYFRTALAWLDRRPEIDVQRVSLLGVSYGSEAALLLGAHYPNLVHGVAALVPSSVVTCGTIGAGRGGFRSHACIGSPWTLAGKPLPYAAVPNRSQPADDPQAVIPVERIPSPVFLACGGRDQIWNSCRAARAIVARRNAHGGEPTQLYAYPDAGHFVGTPSLVFQPGALASDFFVPADERGREDLWPRLLAFLHAG
jgi:dienelactone hydrolase